MIKISNLRLEPLAGEAEIKAAAAKKLGIPAGAVERFGIARMSIDARRGRRTSLVCSVVLSCADEGAVPRRCGGGARLSRLSQRGEKLDTLHRVR